MSAWFITDTTTLAIIAAIESMAGPSFNVPYDTSAQPNNGSDMLSDELLKFQLPGGSTLQGIGHPPEITSMGNAIAGLLSVIAPFISAYTMILPILGVIRGILEVICALLSPWSVPAAIIRLFRKWLPPLFSLFPPLAGVLLILNIIKMILAIIFFIMTVIVPVLELIKNNIENLKNIISSGGDKNAQDAAQQKLEAILLDLANQMGILNVLKPILDIVMAILTLAGGKPCHKKKSAKCPPNNLTGVVTASPCQEDETCCNDDVCPPIFSSPPVGQALVLPSVYADAPPGSVFEIRALPGPGTSTLPQIVPYLQDMSQQLSAQTGDNISVAQYAGGAGHTSTFSVQLNGSRGQTQTTQIITIENTTMTVIDPSLFSMVGVVNYQVVPNWDVLVGLGIVGLGCHPDVAAARDSLDNQFSDLETPAMDKYPELANVILPDMSGVLNDLQSAIVPPFVPPIDDIRTNALNILNNSANNLKSIMNSVLSKIANPVNSLLEVDKNLVRAGGQDKAIITITPKDATGSLIAQNLPSGVSIDVKILNDFGTILNQTFNSSSGTITAELTSMLPGTANITAQVNGQYITEFIDDSTINVVLEVMFISDAVLPKRRLSSSRGAFDSTFDREPGGK